MRKYTAGPWKFFAGSVTVGVACADPKTGDHALIATLCTTRPEAIANAQLIAAAPTMLEVLKRIAQTGELTDDICDCIDYALEKATGENP